MTEPDFTRARRLWERAEEQRDDENAPYLDTVEALSYHVPDLLAEVDRLRAQLAELPDLDTVRRIEKERGTWGMQLSEARRELAELSAENTAQATKVDRTSWTLRDLLRLAHRRGVFLSRARTSDLRTTYQMWEPNQDPDPAQPWNQGRRWVEVHHWPARARLRSSNLPGPTWYLRINGSEQPTPSTSGPRTRRTAGATTTRS
jgi:hypothetical protein